MQWVSGGWEVEALQVVRESGRERRKEVGSGSEQRIVEGGRES